jgi:hypothetical protein
MGRLRTRARWSEPPPTPDWRDIVKSRVIVIASLFALWTAGVEARLVYLQVFQYSEMVTRADKQRMNTVDAPARRGDILDRNGRVLAYTVDADSIFADPSEIKDHEAVAVAVCRALDHCDAADRTTISKSLKRSTQFVYLARKVSPEEEQRVRNLGLKGIGVTKESRRFYPKREMLAHVLGYVGTDNVGLAGLESSFDSLIRGQAGKILLQRDARRNALNICRTSPSASSRRAFASSTRPAARSSSWIRATARSSQWRARRRSTPTSTNSLRRTTAAIDRYRISTSLDRRSKSSLRRRRSKKA